MHTLYKLVQPLSHTMLSHHGAVTEGVRVKERDVHKQWYMEDTTIIYTRVNAAQQGA